MSKFMPKSVSGHYSSAASSEKTQLYTQMEQLEEYIGSLDVHNHPSYTSINEATAYLQYMNETITALNVADFCVDYKKEYYSDIVRYVVISGLIMMSGIRKNIECKVSYLRLSNDEYSPYKIKNDGFPGETAFSAILNEWAEFIDEKLESQDSTDASKIRMLAVVSLNNTPVAYYSSDSTSIMIYPFKTIVSSQKATNNLPGVFVDEITGEWKCKLEHFISSVKADDYLTANQKNVIASYVNKLATKASGNKGFQALLSALDFACAPGVVPNYSSVPVKFSIYKKSTEPPQHRAVAYEELPNINIDNHADLNKFLRVPIESDTAERIGYVCGSVSMDYYYAIGYPLPRCTIFADAGIQWLMVSAVSNTLIFKYAGEPVGEQGTRIVAAGDGHISLDVEYITAGNKLVLGNINFPCTVLNKKIAFDAPNQKLSYFVNESAGMIEPFVKKYWKDVKEIVPLTSECINLLLLCNYEMKSPTFTTNSDGSVTVSIVVVDNNGTAIEKLEHTYLKDNIMDMNCEMSDGVNNNIHPIMPQLSVYPYQNFVLTTDGSQVWNKYFYVALCDVKELYTYFKQLKFVYYVAGTEYELDFQHDKPKTLLNNDGNGFYGYRSTAELIPKHIFVIDKYLGIELGAIGTGTPPVIQVNPANKAVVGMDMGSRNSIVAMNIGGGAKVDYHYARKTLKNTELNYAFCDSFTPMKKGGGWEEIRNLFGVQSNDSEYSFISSVLDYTDEPNPDLRRNPYEHGRIVADLKTEAYQKVLEKAKLVDGTVSPMDDIGLHSDFKRKLWDLTDAHATVCPEVELFVKNACYQMVLNALQQQCGDITIRFTAPNDTCGNTLQTLWISVIKATRNDLGIPTSVHITPDNYMTEAVALFHNISQVTGIEAAHNYTIVIDGGDSTFDVSLFNSQGKYSLCSSFSIKYAGQNLMIDSIKEVGSRLEMNAQTFKSLWGQQQMLAGNGNNNKTIEDLVGSIKDANDMIVWDNDSTKDVLYKLIEDYGFNPTAQAAKKIVALIKLKYCLLLNAVLETCINILPDNVYDPTITISLYGGANNVARLLFPDTKSELKAMIKEWLKTYKNPAKIEDVVINYKVNKNKEELVKGLVLSTATAPTNPLKDQFSDMDIYSNDTYESVVSRVFKQSEVNSPYWDSNTCLLYIPGFSSTAHLAPGRTDEKDTEDIKKQKAKIVFEKIKQSVCAELGDDLLGVPNDLYYSLYTLLCATEQYKKTIQKD